MEDVKELLEREVNLRNSEGELTLERPDPLFVARKHEDEHVALLCALYGYGNAHLIVKFLLSLDFELLDTSEDKIREKLDSKYYRFQNSSDVIESFLILKRLKEQDTLENIFYSGYRKDNDVLEGIYTLVDTIQKVGKLESQGLTFLFGQRPNKRRYGVSPFKRWNMFLRWMVRKDALDMGLWKSVNKRDLIIPLDTHTFKVSQKLGLLKRKSYDLESALQLTQKLREFDANDPVKYDFAIYRLGQEMKI